MAPFFIKLCSMSLTAAYVIIAVMVLRIFLKKAPKIFSYALWGVAAFRLWCPVSFESLFSLLPSADPLPEKILYEAAPRLNTGVPVIDAGVALPAPQAAASANPMQVLAEAGAWIWLAGLLALLFFSALSVYRLHHRLKDADKLFDNVYLAPYIETPFVLGFFRPRIYLPQGLDEKQREYVLRHERTHIRRGDIFIKPFAFLLLCVHWFNPLVWAAFILMSKDMELSCDERVLKELGPGVKADYSALLLSFSAPRARIAAGPLAFGENGAKTRIKNALHYKKPAFWVLLAAFLALAAAAALLLGNPKPPQEEAPLPQTFLQQICDGAKYTDGELMLEIPDAMPQGYTARQLSVHVSGTAPMGEGVMTVHAFEGLSEGFGFEPGSIYRERLAESGEGQGIELEIDAALVEEDGTVLYSASVQLTEKEPPAEMGIPVENVTIAQGETAFHPDGVTGEGAHVFVKLVMTQGRYITEEDGIALGGGIGPKNYVGKCRLEIWTKNWEGKEGKPLYLYNVAGDGGEEMTFCTDSDALPHLLEFEDYNGDGNPEFTLGQWAGSSADAYTLFSIDETGAPRQISGAYEIFASNGKSSAFEYSALFEKTEGGFQTMIYDNALGEFVSQEYQWDAVLERFVTAESV